MLVACDGQGSNSGNGNSDNDRMGASASASIFSTSSDMNGDGSFTLANGDKVAHSDDGQIQTVNGQTPDKIAPAASEAGFFDANGYILGSNGVAYVNDTSEVIGFLFDGETIVGPVITSETQISGIGYEYVVVNSSANTIDRVPGLNGELTIQLNGSFSGSLGRKMAITDGQLSDATMTATTTYHGIDGDLNGVAIYDSEDDQTLFAGDYTGAQGDTAYAGWFIGPSLVE